MDIAAIHASSLGAIEVEAGDSCPEFTWSGSTFRCLPGGAKLRKPNTAGGFSFDADLAITALVDQFNQGAPALQSAMVNTTLTYLDVPYKIDSVIIALGGKQVRILCNHAYQNG